MQQLPVRSKPVAAAEPQKGSGVERPRYLGVGWEEVGVKADH